jgi:hypothetical protein
MQKEMSCHKCGAVFFGSETPGPCPNCGAPMGKDIWRFARGASRYIFWVILAIVWIFPAGYHRGDWQSIAVFLAIGALGLGFVAVVRKKQQGSDLFTGLNPRGRNARDSAIQIAPSSPAPPQVPMEWRLLVSLPRPRDVYLPADKAIGSVVSAVISVALLIFMVREGRYHVAHRTWSSFRADEWILLFTVIASLYYAVASFPRESKARELLRDGEATIGYVVDWESGRSGSWLTYQFWTLTGLRFEHRKRVVGQKNSYSDKGLVPVFYLPQDPSNSIALACTSWRVRSPGEVSRDPFKTVGAR